MAIVFDGLKPLDSGADADAKGATRAVRKLPTNFRVTTKKTTNNSVGSGEPQSPVSTLGGQGDSPKVALSQYLDSLKEKDKSQPGLYTAKTKVKDIAKQAGQVQSSSSSSDPVSPRLALGLASDKKHEEESQAAEVQPKPPASLLSLQHNVVQKALDRPKSAPKHSGKTENLQAVEVRRGSAVLAFDEEAGLNHISSEARASALGAKMPGVDMGMKHVQKLTSQKEHSKKKKKEPKKVHDMLKSLSGDSDDEDDDANALKQLTQKMLADGKTQVGGRSGGRDLLAMQSAKMREMAKLREESQAVSAGVTSMVPSLPAVPVASTAPRLSVAQDRMNNLLGKTGVRMPAKTGGLAALAADSAAADSSSGSAFGGIGALGGAAASFSAVARSSIAKKKVKSKHAQEEENEVKEMLGKADRDFIELVHEVEKVVSLLFQDADVDIDGVISATELKAVFSRAGGPLANHLTSEVEQLLTEEDKSGPIPKDRFIELFIQIWLRVERSPLLLARFAQNRQQAGGEVKDEAAERAKDAESATKPRLKKLLTAAMQKNRQGLKSSAKAPADPKPAEKGLDLVRQLVTG
mmetsp:Transcript_820/g.1569  ORF Transcript_820/g.1569 Transcript_820/m.1569 type:complete len:579 (+) Transcript_820:83-1819(+)